MTAMTAAVETKPKDVYTLDDLQDWDRQTGGLDAPARLAVLGDPVAHSVSPAMHNAALRHLQIPAQYVRLHITPEQLPEALGLIGKSGFYGVNLTIPHKTAALELLADVDPRAKQLGAVNTILVEESTKRLQGFNTDGEGFVRAVRAEFGIDVSDLRILILGAGGGAGRAIAAQCAIEGCERLMLANRTVEKARTLADSLRHFFTSDTRLIGPVNRLDVIPIEEKPLETALQYCDLIVNATSLGLSRTDPPPLPTHLILPHHCVFDSVYRKGRTALVQGAIDAGARAINGLPMLLHQGAAAFEIWFDRQAPIPIMRQALHEQN